MNILSNILKLELYDLINKYTIKIYQYDYYNYIYNFTFKNDNTIYKYMCEKHIFFNSIRLYDLNNKLFYTYYLDFDDRNNIKYYKIRKNYENIKIKYNFITGGR